MEKAVLVAKMQIGFVKHVLGTDNKVNQEELNMFPVYSTDPSNENTKWSKWTPSGSLNLTINNSEAFNKVTPGREYLIYIVPVE